MIVERVDGFASYADYHWANTQIRTYIKDKDEKWEVNYEWKPDIETLKYARDRKPWNWGWIRRGQ